MEKNFSFSGILISMFFLSCKMRMRLVTCLYFYYMSKNKFVSWYTLHRSNDLLICSYSLSFFFILYDLLWPSRTKIYTFFFDKTPRGVRVKVTKRDEDQYLLHILYEFKWRFSFLFWVVCVQMCRSDYDKRDYCGLIRYYRSDQER